MSVAPLYDTLAEASPGGKAHWVMAADGVRLRVAVWPKGGKGTVLIFPGRTEFIEKYGRTVAEFQKRDYAVAILDLRGQGLSDRLVPNRRLGHVGSFMDYQLDINAMVNSLDRMDVPKPYFLCAHSMGGTIGLRSLHEGLPVKRAVFSAPMWGLTIDPMWRPLVLAMAAGSRSVGLGEEFAPGTGPQNYMQSHEFEGNSLTSCAEVWDYMKRLVVSQPGLEIGGPSIHWLYEALIETKELASMDAPGQDALCLIGSDEKVVDKRDVLGYMEKWPNGHVGIVSGARHEILMETPEIIKRSIDMIDAYYSG